MKVLSQENKYNKKLFLTLIADKWIVIANGTGQYDKLFYNQVAKLNRGLYMRMSDKKNISKIGQVKSFLNSDHFSI